MSTEEPEPTGDESKNPWGLWAIRCSMLSIALSCLAIILFLSSCAPAVEGPVVKRTFQDGPSTGSLEYLLDVRGADGKVIRVRVAFANWSRCEVGETYPACQWPKTMKAKR